MRILWVSDPPTAQSHSYGAQTALFVPRLMAAGHEVLVYGLSYHGAQLTYDGITVIGGNGDTSGGLIGYYAERYKADLVITFKDPYLFHTHALKQIKVPWLAIVPSDTEPVSAAVIERINFATSWGAICQPAFDELHQRGYRAHYMPLGIDTTFWQQGDRTSARVALGLPDDVFVAAFVGANQSAPSRKSIEQILIAWAQAIEHHPDAVLFLHTLLGNERGGVDVEVMIKALGIPDRNWRAVDQLAYVGGFVPREQVRSVYHAADVLLNPSTGGGFELTQVEAQACGTPVITTHWTAMRQTAWAGWSITQQDAELEWSPLGGFRLRPHVRAVNAAIMAAIAGQGNTLLMDSAKQGALEFDINQVVTSYWLPALERIEALLQKGEIDHDVIRPVANDARPMERPGEAGRDAPRVEPEAHRVLEPG